MEYTGYTTSVEQVEIKIQADSHEEAVAKLREGDFEAEVMSGEREPCGIYEDDTYGVMTLMIEDTDEELDVETMEVS
jgi:hypothetical protein